MAATYMLRKRLAELEAMKRPEAAADRAAEVEASRRAAADARARFPVGEITAETFEAADQYHKDRLEFWKRALCAK